MPLDCLPKINLNARPKLQKSFFYVKIIKYYLGCFVLQFSFYKSQETQSYSPATTSDKFKVIIM